MFRIIEVPFQGANEAKKSSLLGLLKTYQKFYLSPELQERATFLVAADDTRGVYGGAVIYPQKMFFPLLLSPHNTYEESVINMTTVLMATALLPPKKEYWRAIICLCLDPGVSAAEILETQSLSHEFYKELYQAFVEIGKRKKTDYLAYTLRLSDAYNTKAHKSWPHCFEVIPTDEPSDYTHGILSFHGKQSKAHLNSQSREEQ